MALWAIVPAAGSGRRMQGDSPKQYREIDGLPVLLHTLNRLRELPGLDGIILVIGVEDTHWAAIEPAWPELSASIAVCRGGAERRDSVVSGLEALTGRAAADDWVLVHDAARPCVRVTDIQRLIRAVEHHPAGGLLALPVPDTLKRSDAFDGVSATVDRNDLWAAQTPQLFRYGPLCQALNAAAGPQPVTDESSAMENAGHQPLLVAGSPDNIKITWPRDLHLAALILRAQQHESAAESD